MNVTYYDNNIVYIEFDTQKELSMTFARPQEFYESGFDELKGQVFSLETFLDLHTADDGTLTCFNDWRGYNIPGEFLEQFFERFEQFTKREMFLRTLTQPFKDKKYYLIAGSVGTNVLDHEMVHAHYYLNLEYRKKADYLVESMDSNIRTQIIYLFKEWGYADHVLNDEINAYMSTSSQNYIKEKIKLSIPKEHQIPFIELAESVLGYKINLESTNNENVT